MLQSNVTFSGNLDLSANFSYSSFSSGWVYTGDYNGTLDASGNSEFGVANLGLNVYDDDFFDDKPREYWLQI